VPDLTAAMLPGPYRVPAYRAVGHIRLHQQDAGRHLSRARAVREHLRARALMDAIAPDWGIDRIEVRRRNLVAKEEMPYRRPLATLGDRNSCSTPAIMPV
jgi:CO/xanthine dehydrogenase Mo-binding subunit